MPCNDCSRAENCPPCVNASEAEYECTHASTEAGKPFWTPRGMRQSHWCSDCKAYIGLFEVEEPPMTAEEEEEAPEDADTWPCDDCGAQVPAGEKWCTNPDCQEIAKRRLAAQAPPQPDRRPPYAVAYSVQGHLYEVALPGDATVQAVDGALVVRHHLGPVAGIVQVLPVISEEKPDVA